MREIREQMDAVQCRQAARRYGLARGQLIFFNANAQAVAFDGGLGSGNHHHAGVPGTRGGSAPSGGASCSKTASRTKKLEKALSSRSASDQADYLVRSGAVPAGEAEALKNGAGSGDEEALQKLEEYKEKYFREVKQACMPKDSISSEERDRIAEMSDEEVQEWVKESSSRELTEEEKEWACDYNRLQKVVIDADLTDTPQVVCKEDFDAYVEENGATVVYRGVVDSDSDYFDMSAANIIYQTAYEDGKAYMGYGVSGNGLYTATDWETAELYAQEQDENVMKWAIRSDAKIVEYGSGESEYMGDELSEGLQRALERIGSDSWLKTSEAAVCSGYDAVHYKDGDTNYYIILNRAAVIMQDPMESAADEILGSVS